MDTVKDGSWKVLQTLASNGNFTKHESKGVQATWDDGIRACSDVHPSAYLVSLKNGFENSEVASKFAITERFDMR